jgi:hypothetical protein
MSFSFVAPKGTACSFLITSPEEVSTTFRCSDDAPSAFVFVSAVLGFYMRTSAWMWTIEHWLKCKHYKSEKRKGLIVGTLSPESVMISCTMTLHHHNLLHASIAFPTSHINLLIGSNLRYIA